MNDEATIVLTDIQGALNAANAEAQDLPACLVVVGGDLNGTIFNLEKEMMTIGRGATNDIPLDFNGISRQHSKLVARNEAYIIEDMESRNGTYLNNKKIESPHPLDKGDIIKLGSLALKYLPKGDPERLTYDKLSLEANTDRHTGCFNKSYFLNALELQIKKSKLTGTPLSLIISDLDHFKHLNDHYGHDAGDTVLKEFAAIIRNNGVRENDIFARFGGEEFCLLLPSTNLKQAFEIAERVRKLVESHDFMYEGQKLPVSASLGVSDYRQGVKTGTDLFKRADTAVYQSKSGGRNRVSFFKDA